VGQPELRWAEQAWAHLVKGGLACGDGPLERLLAYVRLFVLGSMYRDWCAIVWDEVHDDAPVEWFSSIRVFPDDGMVLTGNESNSKPETTELI
jgi:hypothetical protein